MLWICQSICDLSDLLVQQTFYDKSIQTAPGAILPPLNDSLEKELIVQEVSDTVILETFHYAADARAMGDPKSGRMRELVKELMRLKTGLPLGIFLI